MHQPPTIPEGDEESEGIESSGERGHVSQLVTPLQPAPIHDSVATAEELQSREDAGAGFEQTPTIQSEIVAVSGDAPSDSAIQAEYKQPSAVEEKEPDDQAKIGEPPATEAEKEIQARSDDATALDGIREDDEAAADQSQASAPGDKALPTLAESPIPPTEAGALLSPRVIQSDDHLKTDEIHSDEHRTPKSGRDRSAKGRGEPPQVDFEKDDHDEEQVPVEEPEIRMSREELLNRYQNAEVERDRLKSINIALQQRLADYLHKRKGVEDIPALAHGTERTINEQQQRYQRFLNDIETLQEKIKHDQIEYEKKQNEYEEDIQVKKEHVEHLKADYVKLVKEIASKAVFARSGKTISSQEVESYLTSLREKEEELIKARHENIRLKNQLKKREEHLQKKEELAEGLHMIDFEQLKIENQTYSEKIEERNEELTKLRKKISTTVQILSHIKEKLSFVQQQRQQAEDILGEKEKEVKQKRDELASIKRRRDRLRQDNQSLKQNSGLIGNEQLLRDYEDRYDDIERCTEKLESLKKRHAEVTLMCKVLKKKISKV